MRFIVSIINWIVYSNLFIGICALCLKFSTDLYLFQRLHFDLLTVFVFFATITSYSLHRLVAIRSKSLAHSNIIQWSKERMGLMWFLFGSSSLACLVLFWFLSFKVQLAIGVLGIMTIFYSVPSFLVSGSRKLRELPGLKIFLIATVWACTTALLPMLQYNVPILQSNHFWWIIEIFLFIFVITLPFDIRDVHWDQQDSIQTIPNSLGIATSKYIGFASILALLNINFFTWQLEWGNIPAILSIIVFYTVVALFLHFALPQKRSDWYYVFYIDGLMILKLILVFFLGQRGWF